jgi:cytochrome P450
MKFRFGESCLFREGVSMSGEPSEAGANGASDAVAASGEARVLPGPKSIGMFEMLRFMRNPRAGMAEYAKKYGDTFGTSDGKGFVAFTGHPEGIKAVFTADPDVFDIPLREQLAPFFGATSLILTVGAKHKKDRKLLTPPFHGARMRAYASIVIETAKREMAKLEAGKPFAMMDVTQSITLEVILRAVFGVTEDARREQFREAVVRLMKTMASPSITMFEFTRHEFAGLGPWARFRRAKAALDALMSEEIAARRESAAQRDDILSMMTSARYDDGSPMSDDELRDQLHLLLFAGHDTTSTSLAWAFYWLARENDVRDKLMAEIASLGSSPDPEAIAALPYLDAVCQETLRIHPVVMNVGRLLRAPLEVRGFTIPAGATVMVSLLMLHNREDLYPEPRAFRPERFLERKFSPFEMVPFGGGARRCIGAALAMYEMKLALATMLPAKTFHLAKEREEECVIRGLTMGPKNGVVMRI